MDKQNFCIYGEAILNHIDLKMGISKIVDIL